MGCDRWPRIAGRIDGRLRDVCIESLNAQSYGIILSCLVLTAFVHSTSDNSRTGHFPADHRKKLLVPSVMSSVASSASAYDTG